MRPPFARPSFAALAVVALTSVAAYTAPAAYANGRFPKAQAITTAPGDDATIYLRATFGVLVSRDGGRSWSWLCEQALGFSSTWDPPVAATRGGRLWVALSDGARSTMDGCSFADVPALHGELVADLTVDGSGEHVLAVTSGPGQRAFVWRGDASSFTRVGGGVAGFRFDTIEVAPSKPSRLYLTATPDGPGKRAHLFRSDDGGATLRELTPALPDDGRLFVASIDPRDPDRVALRQLSEQGSDVLLSTDGGATFRVALHMKGAMFGFSRAPDGSAWYAGSGDPAEGIWRSTDRGETWQPGAKTSVFCLHATATRLLVCSNPYMPGGYAIAASSDRGATVQALATFDDVRGPVACDGGSVCEKSWPEMREAIVTSSHTWEQSFRVGSPDAQAPVDASPDAARTTSRGRSCGCVAAGIERRHGGLAAGAWGALAALAWRRRRAAVGSVAAQRNARSDHRRTATLPPYGKGGSSTIRARGGKS